MPSLVIRCQCGHSLHADDEAALLAAAHEHLAAVHPDLVGNLSEDDLRAMMEEG
jgi:predicted small metal-binding protein